MHLLLADPLFLLLLLLLLLLRLLLLKEECLLLAQILSLSSFLLRLLLVWVERSELWLDRGELRLYLRILGLQSNCIWRGIRERKRAGRCNKRIGS